MIKARILDLNTKQVVEFEGRRLDDLLDGEVDEVLLKLSRVSGEGGPYRVVRYHVNEP